MQLSFEDIRLVFKKYLLLWLGSALLIFLFAHFFIFPVEFGGRHEKWVQDFYTPYWPDVSRSVLQKKMQDLSNRAPAGFVAYRYDYDWKKRQRLSITTVWDRKVSEKMIQSFYDQVYTNVMTALVVGMNLQAEYLRLRAFLDLASLDVSTRRVKKSIDRYERKVEAFERFQDESLISNLLLIVSNKKMSLMQKRELKEKRLRQIKKWYPKLSLSRVAIYSLMIEELLRDPTESKSSPWVFRSDLRRKQFVSIEPWERILVLLLFALVSAFAVAYFFAFSDGELEND